MIMPEGINETSDMRRILYNNQKIRISKEAVGTKNHPYKLCSVFCITHTLSC